MLKLDALRSTPLQRDPFEYLIVRDFVEREKLKQVLSDYPEVPGPGSHPPAGLKISGHFKKLMDELLDAPFRRLVEEKFDVYIPMDGSIAEAKDLKSFIDGVLQRIVAEKT